MATAPTPGRTLTVVLGDIEGSTGMWEADRVGMGTATRRLDEIVSQAAARHRGVRPLEQGEGDSFVLGFDRAADGLACALDLQRAVTGEKWPAGLDLRVRIGVHTGDVDVSYDGRYAGPALNRGARLRALAGGEQTLLSQAAYDLVVDELPPGVILADVGWQRLRGLSRPEHVYQLCHPDLPAEPVRLPPGPAPNNLPVNLSSFVGRGDQIAGLLSLVADRPLVTLTGAGGVGKTRLAVQVAAEVFDRFADGGWFVELAALADPALVAERVLFTLGLRDEPGRSILKTLEDFGVGRDLLVVLDNCEHVLDGVRAVAGSWAGAKGVRVLCTSRVALGVPGETVWTVPPLSLPGAAELSARDAVAGSEAIRLFVERAQAVDRTFTLSEPDVHAVTRICQRLDGVPLAIELAAARVAVLSPTQIADRLDDRFALLARADGAVPDRQRTLRGAVDWSYALLAEAERSVLRRCAVFAAGFSLEAAEEVCVDAQVPKERILDLLDALVANSLVTTARTGDAMRFRLNETTREYTLEQLDAAGERDAVADRHVRWCLGLLVALAGRDQAEWLAIVDVEIDNVRAALAETVVRHRHSETLALAGGLLWFWMVRGTWREGLGWLDAGLAGDGLDAPVRLDALVAAWVLADLVADYDRCERYILAGLAVAREVGDTRRVTDGLLGLAHTHARRGEFAQARALVQEAATLGRDLRDARGVASVKLIFAAVESDARRGDQLAEEVLAETHDIGERGEWLVWSGDFARLTGNYERARARYGEALSIARTVGYDRFVARTTTGLGQVALEAGDLAAARPLLEEARGLWVEVGHRNQLATTTFLLGELARLEDDLATAHGLIDDSLRQCQRLGIKDEAARAVLHLGYLARAEGNRERAGASYRAALTEFAALPYELGIACCLEALAGLDASDGDPLAAARLFGAAEALREELGLPLPPCYRQPYNRDVARARAGRDAGAVEAAWEEGRRTRLDDILVSLGVDPIGSDVVAPAGPVGKAAVPARAIFRRDGGYFTIAASGPPFRLKDSKGLRYIATLLGRPDHEFHVLDLAGEAASGTRRESIDTGDAGEILDGRARAAYKRRLAELEDDLREAESFNDTERAARARQEIGFLADQLAAAVGLGGRSRRASSAAERARVNVTRAVQAAVDKVSEQDPALGRYLAETIKTGAYCSFVSDPRFPTVWVL